MTVTNRELGTTFLVAAVAITVSALIVAWGTAPSLTLAGSGIGIGHLVWPVMFAAAVAFLLHLWIWTSRPPRSRTWPGLPKKLSPEAAAYLLKVAALFRDSAWSLLLVGALVSWAGTRDATVVYCNIIALAGISLGLLAGRPTAIVPLPLWVALLLGGLSGLIENLAEPRLYYGLLGGAGLVLTSMASVDLISLRFPRAGSLFGFPRYRLLALGTISLLSYQSWSAKYGFLESPLMGGLAVAVSATYLADVLRLAQAAVPTGRSLVSGTLRSAADLCLAAGCGLAVWALISALPNVSALLLGQWPNHQFGHASLAHFSHVFDARYLIAAFAAGLFYAVRLPKMMDSDISARYVLVIKAAGYGLAGVLAWLSTVQLAPLGHGYPLIGATIGCGLFAVALALLVGVFTSNWSGLAKVTTDWFFQSTARAFWLGAALVWYGLLVRPLLYDLLSFAPLFEWVVVLAFAVFALYRMRQTVRSELLPETPAPPQWSDWSRHTPDTREHDDPRLDALLGPFQHFLRTGEWSYVWRYVLALLLRNQASLENIPGVFEPMRRCHLTALRPGVFRKPSQKLLEKWRRQALAETMARAERALSSPKSPIETLNENGILLEAAPFLTTGDDPKPLAVLLVAAYWQNGADIDDAAALWFPLITFDDRDAPPFESKFRKVLDRLSRRHARRKEQWNRARRQRMLDGAIAHLFGEGTCEDLAVGFTDLDVLTSFGDSWKYRRHRVPQRRAVEVIPRNSTRSLVRPGEYPNGYSMLYRLSRKPILPKGHLHGARVEDAV